MFSRICPYNNVDPIALYKFSEKHSALWERFRGQTVI